MVRREFREEENRKHVHSPLLLPVGVKKTLGHTPTHPRAATAPYSGIHRDSTSPARRTETQACLSQSPLGGLAESQDLHLVRRCETNPWAACPWEAYLQAEESNEGFTEPFSGKEIEADCLSPARVTGTQSLGFAILMCPRKCGQYYTPLPALIILTIKGVSV